ncbi:MAG: flagellar biosynthesis protein FlhF [Nitrospira sp. BO4]|jgi:flagellar biosynthesis protein FlhF|nr:flagellar biosynthesis protein FlhF [Nitrospira sp. BO4]
MKVKTFHALTMQDAMRAIKEELGPDAIILSSKEVREGGRLLRAFNRPVLEVMAASDQDAQPSVQVKEPAPKSVPPIPRPDAAPPSPLAAQTFQQTLATMLQPNGEASAPVAGKRPSSLKPSLDNEKPSRLRHLHTVVGELSRLLQDLSHEESQPPERALSPVFARLRCSLVEQGMNPSTAELLINDVCETMKAVGVGGNESAKRAVQREISQRIRTSGPLINGDGHSAIGLFIGPSGTGKTSAVAKLAAHYRLEQRKSVAIITFDNHREAAVEELRRYAKLIGAPFACALSARQLSEGLRRHAQVDLVLVDMPGVGPDDLTLAKELRHLLAKETVTTHLVLPASIAEREARRITERLHDLPKLSLLFTKLDETESYGSIFEVAHRSGVPLSYWSVGRRVPGDIEIASADRLAALITAEGSRGSVGQSVRSSGAAPELTGTGTHHG